MTSRIERGARWTLWGLLVLGWVVAVGYMWDGLTTIPSADRLEQTRMAAIPTPRTFYTAAAFSAMELAVVLVALWPPWTGLWSTRLACMVLALVTWFIMTTPMDLSRMDWVHRRWLAFTTLLVLGALVTQLGYGLVRRLMARERSTGSTAE